MCPALVTPRTEESTKASTRGRLCFLDVSGGRVASPNPDASFLALGKFRCRAVQDPVLNKIDALLTRQSFDYGPVARIFLKSRCTASIRVIHPEQIGSVLQHLT